MPAHRLRRAGAADMGVEAEHAVGRRHDDVQVVRDHDDAAPAPLPDRRDAFVEAELPGEVDVLDRLVEDQQVGVAQQRARQQHALALAARKPADRAVDGVFGAGFAQRAQHRLLRAPARQREQAADRKRQRRRRVEGLRQVAHREAGAAPDAARIGLDQAEQHADQGGLAGAVRPDDGQNLVLAHRRVDVAQHVASAAAQDDVLRRDQRPVRRGSGHRGSGGSGPGVRRWRIRARTPPAARSRGARRRSARRRSRRRSCNARR